MIRKIGQAFVLDTAHTTYAFSILPGGHPEHLYYGRTIHIEHPDDLENSLWKSMCLHREM